MLDREDLQLFVRGEAKQQIASVHGKVLNYMKEPELRLIVESKAFNPAMFIDNSPVSGDVSLIAAAYGKLDELKVGAEIKADIINAYGIDIKNLDASVRYAQNQIFIDDLRADVADGWLWASGQCDLDTLSYKGSFRASNINLAMLQSYFPEMNGITGTAMMRGDFKGQGIDFAGLNLSGRLEVDNGSYQSIPIEQIEASFYKEDDKLQVDAMTASFANGGRIAVKGGLIKDEIDADFYASGIDLTLAQDFVGQLDLQGTANFSGRLKGKIDNYNLKEWYKKMNDRLRRDIIEKQKTILKFYEKGQYKLAFVGLIELEQLKHRLYYAENNSFYPGFKHILCKDDNYFKTLNFLDNVECEQIVSKYLVHQI